MSERRVPLSIIIPCYRVERYLARCLDSLLARKLEGIELVCINDGSDDNCIGILRDYESRYPDTFRIIDKDNEGVWKARRDGIAAAHGEYIGFIDPDDHVREDYAMKLYQAASAHGADVACCGFERVDDETGRSYSVEMTGFKYESFDFRKDPGLMLEVNAAIWNKIFRADLLKGMMDMEHIPAALDDMVFAHLIYLNVRSIVFVGESLVYYTVRGGSVISGINPGYIPGIYDAMKELRAIYASEAPELLVYLDAAAFLHLGISLMHRLTKDGKAVPQRILSGNTAFLDEHFPLWRRNPYIRLSYVLTHRGVNFKLWVVRRLSGLHLMRPFLTVYGMMIGRLGIDIKW